MDEDGYLRFEIQKAGHHDPELTLIKNFTTPANAKSFVAASVERYQLCTKLTGIEKTWWGML
jgi:hypothetical protein